MHIICNLTHVTIPQIIYRFKRYFMFILDTVAKQEYDIWKCSTSDIVLIT